jgi:thiamine monophosphate synthase
LSTSHVAEVCSLLLLLLLQFCRPKGIPVIINDRVDVAIAAGANTPCASWAVSP